MNEVRKWTAKVTIAGLDVTELIEFPWDTLREVERAAIGFAAKMIREEYGSDAAVIIFKQLKNDAEPVRNRSHYVCRDESGKILSQYQGR